MKIDWWPSFTLGVLFAIFALPFIQAQLGKAMGGRKAVTKNT